MNIIADVDLDILPDDLARFRQEIEMICAKIYQPQYQAQDRLIFRMTGDLYRSGTDTGLKLQILQRTLNNQDISSYFVWIITTNPNIQQEILQLSQGTSTDPIHINHELIIGDWRPIKIANNDFGNYQYGSSAPSHISLAELSDRQRFLLTESKNFCIYPWIHLHAWPSGEAWPCCHADRDAGEIGHTKKHSLKEIWNNDRTKTLRLDMLNEQDNALCAKCYEQERSGFFSGRQSANKHHGHYIHRVERTKQDGTYDDFRMAYWDIRFSNLCNLRCRSCGHIFSSQWYQDQVKLSGSDWAAKNPVLNYAGRTETDIWEQLVPHFDHVEQVYFAGGEPLLMEEHYRILEELVRRELFHVRLVYNTNFSEVKLKDKWVFDYWKKFQVVSVGASLDAMGPRAEYIRKGTRWDQVMRNREKMLEICPAVDFYASATLSILNAWHISDFHQDWVGRGFLKPQDFNVNILQDPSWYRIDIAPMKYKQRLRIKWEEHLEWLRSRDRLQRATRGFESAIKFMMGMDNTHRLEKFWAKSRELDAIRKENILTVLPELEALYHENSTR